MRKVVLPAALALSAFSAQAQFGSVTYDPTQSAHAAQQLLQGDKLYTTTQKTTQNIIATYNLAQRMATAPQSLYQSYTNIGREQWTQFSQPANTYGNTLPWVSSASTGAGAPASVLGASVPRTSQLTGYGSLTPDSQRAIAAQGATVDLGDTANTTNLQAIGTIRSNSSARESDIARLEAASHSTDPLQQTELATLQRINLALLLMLRSQQDQSQLATGQTLNQLVQQKQQQDELKLLFQSAQGYQANYNSKVSTPSSSVTNAFHY